MEMWKGILFFIALMVASVLGLVYCGACLTVSWNWTANEIGLPQITKISSTAYLMCLYLVLAVINSDFQNKSKSGLISLLAKETVDFLASLWIIPTILVLSMLLLKMFF